MRYRVVVSAENNPYMAWQCKLFHFSCVTRLGQLPLFVVHETDAPLHPDFLEIVQAGGSLRRAPGYRMTARGDLYPPRNTVGTLLHAAEWCGPGDDFIVLCDPDLVFVGETRFPAALAGEFYPYMNFDADRVGQARRALGIPRAEVELRKERLCCGVPYVIPAALARPLAEAWFAALDAFPPRRWEDIMHAFGLAVVRLGLDVELTHTMETNYRPQKQVAGARVLHYCYGDDTWDKRHFHSAERARRVWDATPEVEHATILGEIVSQIKEARAFYRRLW